VAEAAAIAVLGVVVVVVLEDTPATAGVAEQD
jgi:hypothetical protein